VRPAPSTRLATGGGPPPETPASEHAIDSENGSMPRVAAASSSSALSLKVVAGLAIVAALWAGQAVLIPLMLSVMISYALEPLVVRLVACRLPRAAAVPLLLTALLTIGGVGAYVLRGEAIAFVDRLPDAAHIVAQAIQRSMRGNPGTVAKVQQAARELEKAAATATKKSASDGVTPVRIEEPTLKWSDWLWQGSHGVLEFAGQMLVVLCLVFYMLVSGDLYKRKLMRMVPTLSEKKNALEILAEVDRQIERFLLARVVISLVVGVAVWLVFLLLGVEEAGVWGVLSAVLFAIPIVGPTLVVIGAAVAAFVQFGSLGMAAAVGGLCVAIGALEGNVLTPWLMGRVGEMNAVAVFVSLLFWGWLWGAWGLFLAVPITASAKAACERIPNLQAYAELLKE
jgi:predicted PurR-regulated permease PerM